MKFSSFFLAAQDALERERAAADQLRQLQADLEAQLDQKRNQSSIGTGYSNIWDEDPEIERLKDLLRQAEDEIQALKDALERLKKQSQVRTDKYHPFFC